MKKHVVLARFDDKTDALFMKWKAEAFAKQANPHPDAAAWPPHLTIAAYEGIDIGMLCGWANEYTREFDKIDIAFGSLGVFAHGPNHDTDVIYIAPANSMPLMQFYYGFHDQYDEFSGQYGWHYTAKFGYPIFHSTITICKPDELNAILEPLRDRFTPFMGQITALEVYENPIRRIARYELGHV